MNVSSVNWRNKIHDNITKQNILQFFYEILDWENIQAFLGKFRGNSDWDWGRISAPNRVQKKTLYYKQCVKECLYISYHNDSI